MSRQLRPVTKFLEDDNYCHNKPKLYPISFKAHHIYYLFTERLSSLQKPKETVTDDENKPDEDEDVSAILSDIISNVFTMRDLADWARSFSEDSMPMILFAGVSITAALSLSLIAFLALR